MNGANFRTRPIPVGQRSSITIVQSEGRAAFDASRSNAMLGLIAGVEGIELFSAFWHVLLLRMRFRLAAFEFPFNARALADSNCFSKEGFGVDADCTVFVLLSNFRCHWHGDVCVFIAECRPMALQAALVDQPSYVDLPCRFHHRPWVRFKVSPTTFRYWGAR